MDHDIGNFGSENLDSHFALRRVSFLLAYSPYLLLYIAVHFSSRSELKNLWIFFLSR